MRKSVVMPNAKTSISRSSTTRASWSIWSGGQELRLVHDHVVDPAALGQLGDEIRVEVHALVRLDRLRDEAEAGGQLPPLPRPVVPGEDHALEAPPGRAVVADLEARVLLPQSIVPEKNTSSGMRG